MLNAFCIDTEEWFHVCGVGTPYSDPATWNAAPAHIEADTDVILKLLDRANTRGTFLVLGWVAERHPRLVKRIADAGHEIGCHSYYHRLVYEQNPEDFETDLASALTILRDVSGQPVVTYRAPSFSITNACFWAYPVLRRHGIEIDVSMVPAKRDNGGVTGVGRDLFLLHTSTGDLRCFPVSVMDLLGRRIPFSGGGYLRLLPSWLIHQGFRQNHAQGRPGMSYIHPREVNPQQPRLPLPALKRFKYYVNLASTQRKLENLVATFPFTTVSEVCRSVAHWPAYRLLDDRIVPAGAWVVHRP